MTPRVVKWRLRLVENCTVPVMETMPEFSVKQVIETEREGGSVWESFFRVASEVNSTSRLLLSLMAEQIRAGEWFDDVIAQ